MTFTTDSLAANNLRISGTTKSILRSNSFFRQATTHDTVLVVLAEVRLTGYLPEISSFSAVDFLALLAHCFYLIAVRNDTVLKRCPVMNDVSTLLASELLCKHRVQSDPTARPKKRSERGFKINHRSFLHFGPHRK